MNSDDAFLRAALYEQCSKSSILKYVNINDCTIETLRELLNKNNALVLKKIPIILAKLAVKHALIFAKSKMPQLKFMTPENINVDIENDEMQYLLVSASSAKPNLVLMVSKNILVSVIGTSISAFKDTLIGGQNDGVGNDQSYNKINVENVGSSNWSQTNSVKEYTDTFDTPVPSPPPSSSSPKISLSRRTSISSNNSMKSFMSTSSKRSIKSAISKAKLSINRDHLLSPIPNNKNTSDIKKQLLVDEAIEQLGGNVVKTDSAEINIIDNIQIRKPNTDELIMDDNDDEFCNEISDVEMNEEQSDDDGDNVSEADETVKLSELQETTLKPKSVDFYSLVAIDDGLVNKDEMTPTQIINIDDDDGDDNDDNNYEKNSTNDNGDNYDADDDDII